jgi:hypothetical protein
MTGPDPAVSGHHSQQVANWQQPTQPLPTASDPELTIPIERPKAQPITHAPVGATPDLVMVNSSPVDVRPDESPRQEDAPVTDDHSPAWRGEFTPFSVGDPGRAAAALSLPDPDNWDRPDTVLDGVLLKAADGLPAMELRAASVRGRSHRFQARTRQDAYAYRCDGRFVVAAVADGVSSGTLSHVAANIVSRHGCQMIAERLQSTPPEALDWSEILRVLAIKVINSGRTLLQRHPDTERLGPLDVARKLSSTALFAVVEMRPVDGYRPVHVFAYGDTSSWILRSGSRWEPQQPVKNQGAVVASSETKGIPIVPKQAPPAIRARLGDGDVLLLITDGIGDPLGDGNGTVGAFLAQKWRRPPAPLEFAAHVDFARRSHDDDRTAIAIWPATP